MRLADTTSLLDLLNYISQFKFILRTSKTILGLNYYGTGQTK